MRHRVDVCVVSQALGFLARILAALSVKGSAQSPQTGLPDPYPAPRTPKLHPAPHTDPPPLRL